ncbi:NAD(P)H-binding protein [Microbacterium sp. M28]|uniref:NAD(P)H-binding protein n=1 Tax=Microbacterium sp. M28 TaxID=2962064 RepID=UPI0021F43DC3|nr:NAD(P)H-binding protein [Microbacterium sp. M28]UYO97401.1 NAD(P)H-binding protein [Microbacterium sp. M28]
MKVAITGGTGFVGRHLAERLDDVVQVSRRAGLDLADVDALATAFARCDAVVHCAGINREIGDQTFQRVHVQGTRNVVEAARLAGVKRIVMVSFLRARPNCGSGYHESKWEAEELIRASGIEHTIVKSGMIYGAGDHMVDHVTKAVRTLPVFGTVGFRERTARPVPVEDAVDVLIAALEGRIPDPTIALMGVDEITLGEALRRIARVAGRRPAFVPLPVWTIKALGHLTEWTMVVPLVARAQARMLAEGVSEPLPFAPEPPEDIRPARPFDDARIRAALPEGRFGPDDLRIVRWWRRVRAA